MTDMTERIETSRARLRLAMRPPPPVPARRATHSDDSWLGWLTSLPLVKTVVESVTSWWSHHPMRQVAQIASDASNAIVKPVAERNPLTLVLVAGVLGAGLAWSRPWRWIFRSALFAGLVPQLAYRVVSTLPIDSWVSMGGAWLSRPTAARPRPGAQGAL